MRVATVTINALCNKLRWGNRLKMQFFIHHRTHPGFTIGRDGGNNIFKKLSFESLSRIDLSDFLALVIRLRLDLSLLAVPLREIEVAVRTEGGVCHGAH